MFQIQKTRKDVFANMLRHSTLNDGIEAYRAVMTDNGASPSDSRAGYLFETVAINLAATKCISGVDYSVFFNGQLQNLKPVVTMSTLLETPIVDKSGGCSDLTLQMNGGLIAAFSIKNKNKFNPATSDVSDMDNTMKAMEGIPGYKLGLIVRDKSLVLNHRYTNASSIHKTVHDRVVADGLLFDETDILKAMQVFCDRFQSYADMPVEQFIEIINREYLLCDRKQLVRKLHQQMTLEKFVQNLESGHRLHLIAHKPRSGKSLAILLCCKHLLQTQKRILIMTSVPATIDSFVDDLRKWQDFKDIAFLKQDEFATIPDDFRGIVFCSVQYLKTGAARKKEQLQSARCETMVLDESHLGSSTEKTRNDILLSDNSIVTELRSQIPLTIFASGTSEKTRKFYRIPKSCVYEWEIEDEAYMKMIYATSDDTTIESIRTMTQRHGPLFAKCLENITLNADYSQHPTQVLIKHVFPQSVIDHLKAYNARHGTNYGYSASSLFALDQVVDANGQKSYRNQFEIAKSTDGEDVLAGYLGAIISSDPNQKTILKSVEATQHAYESRKSTKASPQMIIVFLPTHTRNNTIDQLQETLLNFLHKHRLWQDYNVEYSNAQGDTNNVTESYNDKIKTYMDNTRYRGKKGCILLLGSQGTTGITYHDCDVTISLDDGQNLDQQKQRFSRALTEAPGKTIGINVDLNIQRHYQMMSDVIHRHRQITKTTATNCEILTYLLKHNIFLFNPQELEYGKVEVDVIKSYYNTESTTMLHELDDAALLERIDCEDDLSSMICTDLRRTLGQIREVNEAMEGAQQDCPEGGIDRVIVNRREGQASVDATAMAEEEAIKETINQTLEACKFIFPVLALLSNSTGITCFKALLVNDRTKPVVIALLREKKINIDTTTNLKPNSYSNVTAIMNMIIDNNLEIIHSIREIYANASPDKLRDLIAHHFIPSDEERRANAEVSTPVVLVDDMLTKVPRGYFETPKFVLEPCCGKGNFVLGIFEKMYDGLVNSGLSEIERCKIVMDHLYYSDLTEMNVFITTELLKCHIQAHCGVDAEDFAELGIVFHSSVGNSLTMTQWHGLFDMVIANPPYNDDSGNKGKGHNIWVNFIETTLDKWLKPDGYMLFVNPSVWRQLDHPLLKKMMANQLVYLEIHNVDDGMKTFKCSTRYDWYLLQKTPVHGETIVKDEEGVTQIVDLKEWSFIPNMKFDEIKALCAKSAENTDLVEIIHSESDYEVRRKWMSHGKTAEHVHPVIYSINKDNVPSFKWSNTKDKGHYGVSKFVFTNGAGFLCDENGEYGISQWGSGIVDSVENLPLIERAFRNPRFQEIKRAIQLDSSSYNIKVMRLFRNDFWRAFV
jgi:hypothetical protein